MRPTQVVQAIEIAIQGRGHEKQPVMIHGQPGVGKSQVVRQVKEKTFGKNPESWRDFRLSQFDAVDMRGVPCVQGGKTVWNTPGSFPTDGEGIMFLDELPNAPQAVQAAAYQLILDRQLGDYYLPDGWALVAAGNRIQDRALTNPMSTALKNRFQHINFEVNNDDWCQWALQADVDPSVLAFIRFRPNLLNEFEVTGDNARDRERAQKAKDANAFATPRSWEFLSRTVSKQPPKDIEFEIYCGLVGEGPASEFIAYLKVWRDLPNLDAVLLNPDKAKVPSEPAILYAMATGLAAKANEDNMERVTKYALRIQPEFQVLLMKDCVTRNNKLASTKSFNEWALKNADVLL